jgi:uncharacterized membrane protein
MNVLGWFHTTCAVVALLSGAAVLMRRKGTSIHRRTGWVYVGSMLLMNGTALMIYRLFGGFGPFHVAAIFSLVTIVGGIVPAVRRRPNWLDRHYQWMSWSYVGLWAAAASEVTTRVPGFQFWWMVLAGTVAVLVVGAVIIRRHARAVTAPFRQPAAATAD